MRLQDIDLKKWTAVLAVVVVWVLACKGCDRTPVPDEKSDWLGTWISDEGSQITIYENGECEYEWKEGSTTRRGSGGAARWEDDKFYCAVLFDTDFAIEEPPVGEDGDWTMKLEGQRLEKR